MWFNPQAGITRVIGRKDGRRAPGRVLQESLVCDLGPVLDLSAGGMRLLSTRPRLGEVRVRLWGFDVNLTLRARVAWTHRLGFRRHELGLAFLDIDEDVARILTRISTIHRARCGV